MNEEELIGQQVAFWRPRLNRFGKELKKQKSILALKKAFYTQLLQGRRLPSRRGPRLQRTSRPALELPPGDRGREVTPEVTLTGKMMDPPESEEALAYPTTGRQGVKIDTMQLEVDNHYYAQIACLSESVAAATEAVAGEDTAAARANLADLEAALQLVIKCQDAVHEAVKGVVADYLKGSSCRIPALATWLTGTPYTKKEAAKHPWEAADIRDIEVLHEGLSDLFMEIKAVDGAALFQRSGTWKDYAGKSDLRKREQREALGFVGPYSDWPEKIIARMPVAAPDFSAAPPGIE